MEHAFHGRKIFIMIDIFIIRKMQNILRTYRSVLVPGPAECFQAQDIIKRVRLAFFCLFSFFVSSDCYTKTTGGLPARQPAVFTILRDVGS